MPLPRYLCVAALATCVVAMPWTAWADAVAVVGILEGKATVVRQVGKLAVVEGLGIEDEDIVETPAGGFLQIEFDDGTRVGIGPESRLIVHPRGQGRKRLGPRIYLLQGWVKITHPGDGKATATYATPRFELASVAGATLMRSDDKLFLLFVESGSAALGERRPDQPPLEMRAGGFARAPSESRLVTTNRPSPEFLAEMPRAFRDPLPGRADRFKGKNVAGKPQGDVSYDEVSAWLGAESAVRLPMVQRWRPRLRDKAFRAALIAQLPSHPEWDPLLFPEKWAQKRADERRAREAKAQAAEAAASAAPN